MVPSFIDSEDRLAKLKKVDAEWIAISSAMKL